ncbi:MAG TPA: TIGR03667 family PPOX class F420-dependent oxidoreductase [Ktedonobacteraceae bacterium]|nr:TIGR03667 family PPOX class F420-dependent oxidoreductase [Ktedonobacteraceae bacterium]
MPLDISNPKDAHVDERLRNEPMIWLSTVRPDGRPHLVPVWFFWNGETITIYSQPANQKMRNLQHNPNVALALNTSDDGDDVVIVEGKAELLGQSTMTMNNPAYLEKYDTHIKNMQADPEQMAADYSEVIRVTPTRFISWGG